MIVAFIARDLAGWLGIPAGVVIAAMVLLRKRGKELRARRHQARQDRAAGPR
jgi:hypothetical protein